MLRILGLREGEMGLSAERLKTHIGADELKAALRGIRLSPAPSPRVGNSREDPFSSSPLKPKPNEDEEEATPVPQIINSYASRDNLCRISKI